MYGLDKRVTRDRIDQLLRALGLEHGRDTFAAACSHGMRKKTSFAMALLPNPEVLFLDEPFEAIDPVTSKIMRDLLQSVAARGITVFFTSHVLSTVRTDRHATDHDPQGADRLGYPGGGSPGAARTALFRPGGSARGGGDRVARVAAVLSALRHTPHLIGKPVVQFGAAAGWGKLNPKTNFCKGYHADVKLVKRLRGDEGRHLRFRPWPAQLRQHVRIEQPHSLERHVADREASPRGFEVGLPVRRGLHRSNESGACHALGLLRIERFRSAGEDFVQRLAHQGFR